MLHRFYFSAYDLFVKISDELWPNGTKTILIKKPKKKSYEIMFNDSRHGLIKNRKLFRERKSVEIFEVNNSY